MTAPKADLATVLRPELPGAALHGLPGEIATALAEITGADPAALLVIFLTMLGNAIGAQPHAQFGGAAQPARLFALIVGDAATGRKGTAYEAVEGLFRDADPDWADSRVMFGLQSAEAMIDRVADGDDPRLMIVETEFGRLLRVMERAGNMNTQLRNAFDGRTLQRILRDRRKSQQATGAHISLLGMITPGELLRLHRHLREAGGLESRILYCVSAPTRQVNPFQASQVPGWLAGSAREAIEASRRLVMSRTDPVSAFLCGERSIQPSAVLPVADDVRAGWLSLIKPLLPAVDTSLGAFFGRAETQVIRLAVTYALADQADEISIDHIYAAIALWDYCARSAEVIFGIPVGDLTPSINPKHRARVVQALHDRHPAWMPRDQIGSTVLHGNVPAADIEAILDSLHSRGLIEWRQIPTAGRPRVEFRLVSK
jgi:Protein of unknown function (DUF3987)